MSRLTSRRCCTSENVDPLGQELDAPALKIETVIAGGQDGNVRLRPLDRARYLFTVEYRADTMMSSGEAAASPEGLGGGAVDGAGCAATGLARAISDSSDSSPV